ncbi:MAG: DNA polymerase III subunit delta [Rhodobacteraceae bacterium]|nr:DNA polymerase III subunit delta [Paracoccaceae bacterium]
MILKGAEAARYFARPDPGRAGLLICGADAMRVAMGRQDTIAALIGPTGEGEMRLTRLAAGDVRRAPALLYDAIKAQGFFPGPRVVFVEDATDTLTAAVSAALADWQAGDAQIIVTAGALTAKSPLKALFEKHPNAYAATLYDDPPSRAEIEFALEKAGLRQMSPEALADLTALARAVDPGDFRQTLEKIALYKFGDPSPLTPEDVAAMAPASLETEVDSLIFAVADGRGAEIGPLLRRLEAQGTNAVGLCIAAMRHFRMLHTMSAGGAAGRQMPYRQRDMVQRQSTQWGIRRLEAALSQLVETDLTLRSSSRAPAMAVMERCLVRLASLANARG